MKKPIAIIRFGVTQPLPKEITLIQEFSGEDFEFAIGCKFHDFGVASFILSEASPEEIVNRFRQVADDTGDVLPMLVFELNSPSIRHDFEEVGNFNATKEQFLKSIQDAGRVPAEKKVITLSLDELLDLVQSKGLENLTSEERARLEDLSK